MWETEGNGDPVFLAQEDVSRGNSGPDLRRGGELAVAAEYGAFGETFMVGCLHVASHRANAAYGKAPEIPLKLSGATACGRGRWPASGPSAGKAPISRC